MRTVAISLTQFPSAVESYVGQEIEELRSRGVRVVAESVRRPDAECPVSFAPDRAPEIGHSATDRASILPFCMRVPLPAPLGPIADLIWRVAVGGSESPLAAAEGAVAYVDGACYALHFGEMKSNTSTRITATSVLDCPRAARLLDVGFSLTLPDRTCSLHGAYLRYEARSCTFCLTVLHYNRLYILSVTRGRSPKSAGIAPRRRHIRAPEKLTFASRPRATKIRSSAFSPSDACHRSKITPSSSCLCQLRTPRNQLRMLHCCEGPERRHLTAAIRKSVSEERVTLLGHIPASKWIPSTIVPTHLSSPVAAKHSPCPQEAMARQDRPRPQSPAFLNSSSQARPASCMNQARWEILSPDSF